MAEYVFKLEDIEPLLEGLAILGTGGGGSPEWGRAIMKSDMESGRVYKMVDPEDIQDDAFVISGGIMGSVKTLEKLSIEQLMSKWDKRFELLIALKAMERLCSKKVNYVVPFEVGGLNTPVMFALAARAGIPVINGDGLGRCAPETQMTSFIGHDISLTPMPLADHVGNTIIVTESVNSTFSDEIGRYMVTNGGGLGGNSHYPMSGAQLKKSVIPKTISLAMEIGKVVLEARNKGEKPVEAFRNYMGGINLFKGKVTTVQGEDKGGFYRTVVKMAGTDDFAGVEADLIIKNESMALWVDKKIRAIFPDLICMLEDDGRGVMSIDISEGKTLNLVGLPCHARLRASALSPIGREAFGPARYGCPDLEYQPIEDLNK